MRRVDRGTNALPDRQTNRPTNQPTDTAYYGDARTHLKRIKNDLHEMNEMNEMNELPCPLWYKIVGDDS